MKTARIFSYNPLANTEKYESADLLVRVVNGGALVVHFTDRAGSEHTIGFAQSYWKRYELADTGDKTWSAKQ